MGVFVLRLGHRKKRDERVSTHCGLVARAFGAKGIIFSGEKDEKLLESLKMVQERWGGDLEISYEKNWKEVLKKWDGKIVHLTMYGIPIQKRIVELRKIEKKEKILVVIGSEKVPGEVYHIADYNIAITNQPHSEIAALAIFLHELFEGKELDLEFENAKLKIIPQEKGKKLTHC